MVTNLFQAPAGTADRMGVFDKGFPRVALMIGYAGSAWNLLEHVVKDSSQEFYSSEKGQHLSAGTEPTNKQTDYAYKYLGKVLASDSLPQHVRTELERLKSELNRLADVRNVVCHSVLEPVTTNAVSWVYARGFDGHKPYRFDVDRMEEHVGDIMKSSCLLGFITDHLFSELRDYQDPQGKSFSLNTLRTSYLDSTALHQGLIRDASHGSRAIVDTYQGMREGSWFGWGGTEESWLRWCGFWESATVRENCNKRLISEGILAIESFNLS